jgi:diguanylate cyclase (GGDEF)-like protein
MTSRHSLSISSRFNLLTATLVLATTLSVGGMLGYRYLADKYDNLLRQGQVVARLTAQNCEYALFTRNVSELLRQLGLLQNVPGLAYALVSDRSGIELARVQFNMDVVIPNRHIAVPDFSLWQLLTEFDRSGAIEWQLPIQGGVASDEEGLMLNGGVAGEAALGQLRLGLNLREFRREVVESIQKGGLMALMILAFGMVACLVMTARLTAPLKRLARAANDVVEGRCEPVAIESGGAELRELGQAFNQMTTWLNSYYADVTNYRDMLERLAYYDDLTGLANRTLLRDHIELALAQAKRRRNSVALLFLDLDRFKNVNDTLGHSVGDQLIRQVAERLRQEVRGGDSVARMGGDEFVVVLNDMSRDVNQVRAEAKSVAEHIGIALMLPFQLGQHEIATSFSIGIALYPHDTESYEELIQFADTAMYVAKENGRNTFRFFHSDMNQRGVRRLSLESSLRRAVDRGEFELFFQPKLNGATGELIGAETLLRWRRDDDWISPAEFIPIAEETGLILPIGEWVLETALITLRDWLARGICKPSFQIGINVSPMQFWHPDFAGRVAAIVKLLAVNANGSLEMELTESCLMRGTHQIMQTFLALREVGIRFALDDFGTGYSNLGYLKLFPLDVLKIDQSFVRDCVDDPSDAAIVRAVIAVAKGLGLDVIAEGVENDRQARFLRDHGCHLLQGYWIARPMPARDFEVYCAQFAKGALQIEPMAMVGG